MSKVHQSLPVILGFAVIGLGLYNEALYRSLLDHDAPAMPWRLGSYCIAIAMGLYLMRRGRTPLVSILVGVAVVAVLNLLLVQHGRVTQQDATEQSHEPMSISARLEGIQRQVDALGINRILRPEKLGSAEGIAVSRQRLARFAHLIQERDALLQGYADANRIKMEAAEGNPVAKWNRLSKAQKDTIALSYEILDFANGNLADAKLRKDEITYKTPEQVRRYKALTGRMDELSEIELQAWNAIDCLSGKSQLCL